MSNQRYGGPIDDMRWLSCQNVGTSDIPGFAMVQVYGVITLRGQNVLQVGKCFSLNGVYAINNAVTIKGQLSINPNMGYGNCTLDFPAEVLFNNSSVTPLSIGATCGPKINQWYCDATGSGFNFIANPNKTRAWVIKTPGPVVGKVFDPTIPMRSLGYVEIWTGPPGTETDSTQKQQYINHCPQTLTVGCWVSIMGSYVFQVINPARIVDIRISAPLPAGTTYASPASIAVGTPDVLGFFDGWSPLDMTVIPTLKLYSSPTQPQTIPSGTIVRAIWNDVKQRYEALDWGGCL